jgi:hypothetical protein
MPRRWHGHLARRLIYVFAIQRMILHLAVKTVAGIYEILPMFAVRQFQSLLAGAALIFAACQSTPASEPAAIHLRSTRDALLINESATLSVNGDTPLGAHPKIEWSTSMGKVTPVREGMLDFRPDRPTAIFTSDTPGQAIITARLTMDDGRSLADSVKIAVNPLR